MLTLTAVPAVIPATIAAIASFCVVSSFAESRISGSGRSKCIPPPLLLLSLADNAILLIDLMDSAEVGLKQVVGVVIRSLAGGVKHLSFPRGLENASHLLCNTAIPTSSRKRLEEENAMIKK